MLGQGAYVAGEAGGVMVAAGGGGGTVMSVDEPGALVGKVGGGVRRKTWRDKKVRFFRAPHNARHTYDMFFVCSSSLFSVMFVVECLPGSVSFRETLVSAPVPLVPLLLFAEIRRSTHAGIVFVSRRCCGYH